MEAVQRRADMAGIDMRLVLQQQQQQQQQSLNSTPPLMIKEDTAPPPFVSKYKRMLKRGVPLPAVQQLAFLEGGFTPKQVAELCASCHARKKHRSCESDPNDLSEDYQISTSVSSLKQARLKSKLGKYHRMIKVGIPASTVEKCMSIDQDLKDAMMVEDEELKYLLKDLYCFLGTIKMSGVHFSVTANGIKFHSSRTPLATLIQKMVQKVHHVAIADEMEVDDKVLYQSLGALQGVQLARDNFNSTLDCDELVFSAEIKIQRQAFVEIAKSIAMKLPAKLMNHHAVDIPGLDDLVCHICKRYESKIIRIKDQLRLGKYDFDSLALLYPPGSRVIAKNVGGGTVGGCGGVDMMCLVAWNRYEMGIPATGKAVKVFKVCFQFIVALGPSEATMVEVVESIPIFQESRQVMQDLTFIPLHSYSATDQERFWTMFGSRGKAYNEVALCGSVAHMEYQKGSFFLKQHLLSGHRRNATPVNASLESSGRMIVDVQGAYEHGHTLSFGYEPMIMGIKYKFKEFRLQRSMNATDGSNDTSDTFDGLVIFDQIPERFLQIVWPCVVGFSLTMKAWGDFLVDGLSKIQWKKDTFDRLVLPENHKRMIKALVRNKSDSFQDLVDGKGQGTIFLMYGPAGVGKTLTAEAAAEVLHKPLYSLSMGSMGTTAHELEQRLEQIMSLSVKWDALILLDEADSFLETRSSNSPLERNAMVSVMLKLLEYFSGILFLTSNRINSLDPAFLTRITLALRYEPLDKLGRKQVWENLLIRSGYENLLQDNAIHTGRLASIPLNGREIKNALRLGISIATEDGESLSHKILMETVGVVYNNKRTMSKPIDGSKYTKYGIHNLKWW